MTHQPIELAELLAKFNVQFVIIGGHAVNFHGFTRATEDIDIIIQRTVESDEALFQALSSINAFWISNEIDPATGIERTVPVSRGYLQENHLMMLGTDVGYLDIFDFVPGFRKTSVSQVFEDAVAVESLRFVSLNWLRKMKAASGRPIDKIDLANLG
jgi:hypothetical protein